MLLKREIVGNFPTVLVSSKVAEQQQLAIVRSVVSCLRLIARGHLVVNIH
jgi:hypothetical protein